MKLASLFINLGQSGMGAEVLGIKLNRALKVASRSGRTTPALGAEGIGPTIGPRIGPRIVP